MHRLFLIAILFPSLLAANEPSGKLSNAPVEQFARLALSCVHQEYPNKIAHVMSSDQDIGPPRELTPIFYGCFDWHSSVHGHWLLVRLLRLHGDREFAGQAITALEVSFQAESVAAEVAYAMHGQRASFERPYGIAWLLQLMTELREWDDPVAKRWQAVLEPLEAVYVRKTTEWLNKLAYPIRIGEHAQTAFAFALFLDWAKAAGNEAFFELVKQRSLEFYSDDVDCPLAYEPGGQDFLSACLAEADLMRRVMPPADYAAWLENFMPGIPTDGSTGWLSLAVITDRSDGKLAHLDGLHLSRAWALDGMAEGLPANDPRIASIKAAVSQHAESGLAAVTGEHYEGGHWLGSFATYLVTRRGVQGAESLSGSASEIGSSLAGFAAMRSRMAIREPSINAVIMLNPNATSLAAALDSELEKWTPRGPLHGLPVLLKDNIETLDMPTTAGSLALKDNHTSRDAEITRRLRNAGLLIAGKTNLSEWANFRDEASTSGWSAVGGLTQNAWGDGRNACGSSSGSAAAVAAGYVPFAIGTETDGSIVCPASYNGVVGIKPTVGLVSRRGIIPIAHSQDTAGPIAYSVKAAALLLSAMEGEDPGDLATTSATEYFGRDYLSGLEEPGFGELRFGVIRSQVFEDGSDEIFIQAIEEMRTAGAQLVDDLEFPEWPEGFWDASYEVLLYEFKHDLAAYLASLPGPERDLDLAALIAFNQEHAEQEMPWFGQDIFHKTLERGDLESPEYLEALEMVQSFTRNAIDQLMEKHRVDILLMPTNSVPSKIDLVLGDRWGGGSSSMAAISGYPHVTVPSGRVKGLPIGLSFVGTAFSEPELIRAAYAYEQASGHATTLSGDDPWNLNALFSKQAGDQGLPLSGVIGEALAIPGLVAEGAWCKVTEGKEGESQSCE